MAAEFGQQLADAKQVINSWAGLDDWSGLGPAAQSTPDSMTAGGPPESAPGSLVQHHYQNNASGTTQTGDDPAGPPASPDTISGALSAEADILTAAMSQLFDLAGRIGQMPLADFLTELLAIIADTLIDSAGNVINAFVATIEDIAAATQAALNMPIHIPVVSDVLNFFGVPDLTVLDITCWLAAVPATLLAKLAAGEAPFPDDDQTNALIHASSFAELQAVLAEPKLAVPAAELIAAAKLSLTGPEKWMSFAGHFVSGLTSIVGAVVSGAEALEPEYSDLAKPSAVLGAIGGGSGGLASLLTNKLVPIDAIKDPAISKLSESLTTFRIFCKLTNAFFTTLEPNWPTAQWGPFTIVGRRSAYGAVDASIGLLSFIPVLWHYGELAKAPDGPERAIALEDETSNVFSILQRILYFMAVSTANPDVQVGDVVLLTLAGMGCGILQLFEAFDIIANF
jgi:hypothetical protein